MLDDTIRSDGLRQSDRVSFRMPVEASWTQSDGAEVKHIAETLLVSRNGGVLRLEEKLTAGQEITLRRMEGDVVKTTRARVMAEIDQEPDGFLYEIQIAEPRADFWDIEFPAPYKADEAQAEIKTQEKGAAHPLTVEERVIPRRNRTRVKARVLACIRRRGFQEEVAVCEDLSKGGISFRSRNQYPEGTRVEVAVPFTPGSAAIFVPIRIVSSQAIPAAGLFRHGAAYVRPPLDSGA